MILRSSSVIKRDCFCGPAITRSIASSKSVLLITLFPSRAASNAASFNTLARSAPVNPGVRFAYEGRSTFFAIGLFFACTARIAARPFKSGRSTGICRSNLPGRNNAGSKTSGRLVAAIKMTAPFASKPSISTNNWFNVCSRSSFPPPKPAPRWRPTASISSIKTIAGELAFACVNKSRTRDAPTPTNISTNSEPEIE